MPQIEEPAKTTTNNSNYAFLDLAFRPFFLGAAGFAIIGMMLWTGIYSFGAQLLTTLSPIAWHSHEMIFGYSVAVIAGFLLTAIQNWTGVATVKGTPLLIVFLTWLVVRILPFVSIVPVTVIALIDTLFFILLIIFATKPVLQTKQYKQLGIIIVLLLLLISNSVFYLGVLQIITNGVHIGLYAGMYLILLLIFIMARRVIPFFIQKGVDQQVSIKNFKWLDIASLILFVLYALFDLFYLHQKTLLAIAGMLLLLHSIRMIGWYTNGIWKKPLLWSIYIAYGFIVSGFALKLLIAYYGFLPFLEIHAFTVGGIGLLTLSMMSRVALGHTGRNVFEPPRAIFWIVLVFSMSILFRIVLPIFSPNYYSEWIVLSQVFWIAAFSLFFIVYFPILIKPRIDEPT